MSQLLDSEVAGDAALVIDSSPNTRHMLVQTLRSFGFAAVKAASRIVDAREMLEGRGFRVVLCDDFEQGNESGQDLLEELRREQLLPYATVFVMITSGATYSKVAEAAEAALDSYMVKPFSANSLFERLREARQRKRELREIFEAMEGHRLEQAANLCLQRFEQRLIYWLYAARIGAELLLSLKRNQEARQLYDSVIAAKTLPWARLGVARVQLAAGDVAQARRTLEVMIGDCPGHTDSYDVLGKVQMELGQIDEAMETYKTAAAMTPGCILRLQHAGTLSFYAGDTATATRLLERTWAMGSRSRLFDVLSMMLLAFLRFDARDGKALAQAEDALRRFSSRYPQSSRLRRMAQHGAALMALHEGATERALEIARKEVAQAGRPEFDIEAATNLLSIWSRLRPFGIDDDEYAAAIRRLAMRFAVNKATTEVLVAAVRREPEASNWVREAQIAVGRFAEQSMDLALSGSPKAAVETLLRHGGESGNARLIEMAGLMTRRHQDRIDNFDAMLATADSLSHRFCAPSTHIAGVRRSNRSAGGLVLRR